MKMRLPTSEEWDALVKVTGGKDDVIHWKPIASWVNENGLPPGDQATRGRRAVNDRECDTADARRTWLGFRPAIDIQPTDKQFLKLKDGDTVVVGTLYMGDAPVKAPAYSNGMCNVWEYIPGTTLEMRTPLRDGDVRVTAIKVGNVLIADRVLLNYISYHDIAQGLSANIPMRLPTEKEWDCMVEAVGGRDKKMHWNEMGSLLDQTQWVPARNRLMCVSGGDVASDYKGFIGVTERCPYTGFRPVFDHLATGPIPSDLQEGESIVVGTLYMNGEPVKVPKDPTSHGDIPAYILKATLGMREPLEDPDYQVRAIRVGNILVANRTLLSNISYEDIQAQIGSEKRRKDNWKELAFLLNFAATSQLGDEEYCHTLRGLWLAYCAHTDAVWDEISEIWSVVERVASQTPYWSDWDSFYNFMYEFCDFY